MYYTNIGSDSALFLIKIYVLNIFLPNRLQFCAKSGINILYAAFGVAADNVRLPVL